MANNKLLHYNTKLRFEEAVLNHEISNNSIAFIKETSEIYTHGKLYEKLDVTTDDSDGTKVVTHQVRFEDPVYIYGGAEISSWDDLSTASGDTLQQKLDDLNQGLDGKADLMDGKILSTQLPSYVDDVLEYSSIAEFPNPGESGKIYVDKTNNLTYRWSGSTYVEISKSLALGETSATAYPGNKGKADREDIEAYKEVISISGDNNKNTMFNAVTADTTTTFNDWTTFNKSPRVNGNIYISATATAGSIRSNNITYKGAEIDDTYYKKTDGNNLASRIVVLEAQPSLSVSVNPSIIYAGEPQTVHIASAFNTTSGIVPDKFTLTRNGNDTVVENVKSHTFEITDTFSGTSITKVAVTYTISGIKGNISKNVTMTAVYPIYWGFSVSPIISIDKMPNKLAATTNPKTTYVATSTANKQFLFIYVPANIDNLDINKFTMGGAPVAMSKSTIKFDGIDYNMYYTQASYDKGTTLTITAN